MKVQDIFLALSAHAEIDQNRFLIFFNETIDEINLLYPVIGDLFHAEILDENTNLAEIFVSPVIDNIMYHLGLGDKYKSEFLRKMKHAFCAWWKKKNTSTRFIKRSND